MPGDHITLVANEHFFGPGRIWNAWCFATCPT